MSFTMTDLYVVAQTIYGEARGESFPGQVAVGWVIRNRVARGGWWGDTWQAVCQKPWQFSAWNADDPNRALLDTLTPADPVFAQCLRAALEAVHGEDDPTHGATHYYAESRWAPPYWAAGLRESAVIGGHRFYAGVA